MKSIVSHIFFICFVPLFVLADVNSEFQALVQSFTEERLSPDQVHCGFINYIRLQQLMTQVGPDMQMLAKEAKVAQRPVRQDSVLSPGGHFMLHFNWTGQDSVPNVDIGNNGVPDFVDSAGVYLEKTWDVEITQLGFHRPPGKDGNPIQVYPVYFTNFSYYGLTTPEDMVNYNGVTESAYTSYLELHNDYEGSMFYSNGLEGLKVTAAHEFHHAIQLGYNADYSDNIFFMEMTSTWLEDYVFEEVNDYVFYLNSFFRYLFSISFTSTSGFNPYANCLYVHMLEKKYGPKIITDTWDRIINEKALIALDHELHLDARNSSFAESQNQYAGWLYFTGSRAIPDLYFPEGADYPEIEPDEGIESFDFGIADQGIRLIELTPPITGLAKAKVISQDDGKFSHIINHQLLTKPVDFGSNDIITINKNETTIVVLSNPNDGFVDDLEYEVKRGKIITVPETGEGPIIISSNSSAMNFFNVPENATIRIFNILGQKIRTLRNESGNQLVWNLKDSSGKRITTGTYIYHVKTDGFELTGKLTVFK